MPPRGVDPGRAGAARGDDIGLAEAGGVGDGERLLDRDQHPFEQFVEVDPVIGGIVDGEAVIIDHLGRRQDAVDADQGRRGQRVAVRDRSSPTAEAISVVVRLVASAPGRNSATVPETWMASPTATVGALPVRTKIASEVRLLPSPAGSWR